jgi:predicted CXXCH cytochrome family protein
MFRFVLLLVFFSANSLVAQDVDTIVTTQNRSPSTIAEQIPDLAERQAFFKLLEQGPPAVMLERSNSFLRLFPRSAFLFEAEEIAARANFAMGDDEEGLKYARQSLRLLPENPLLLVSVSDVEAKLHQDDRASEDARDAIEYLETFASPATVAPDAWPELKNKLMATANFALGRALLDKALVLPPGSARSSELRDCVAALSQAHFENPSDVEIIYLKGLAEMSSRQLDYAAEDFSRVYWSHEVLSGKAYDNLQTLYKEQGGRAGKTFEAFVEETEHRAETRARIRIELASANPGRNMPEYAGSKSCRTCHSAIYRQWSETGMAKMLRPYTPENVIGDFSRQNEFNLEDDSEYSGGKVTFTRGPQQTLFARMVMREGRHYFEIQQSDGKLHTYPVDYTIGSKFQQAYATTLPNGEIHVFPIQYNARERRWMNYWKIIDGGISERANLRSWETLNTATSYQAVCAVCHTSQLSNVKGGGFQPTNVQFREPGIDCEMCHGPSAQHVVEMTLEGPYPGEFENLPVDFDGLNNRDFVRICAQCHMQSALRKPDPGGALNFSRSGNFFPQNLCIPFGEFSRLGFYKDGRFRQTTFIVEALRRSKCFKKGNASCGSCHDPHGPDAGSNPTALKYPGQPDMMCLQCHTQLGSSSAITGHTHHPPESEGSRCVSCHMPRIMDAVLFRARTHQIDDIPDPEMTERFGQQDSPNACLLCHSEKTSEWVKQALATWTAR